MSGFCSSGLCSGSGPRARGVWRVALMLALLVLAAAAIGGRLGPVQNGVLIVLPGLSLAVLMLTRPYLGERLIARLRTRRRWRRRRRGASLWLAAPTYAPARVTRGGRLIAVALAGRAPPPALASCR